MKKRARLLCSDEKVKRRDELVVVLVEEKIEKSEFQIRSTCVDASKSI